MKPILLVILSLFLLSKVAFPEFIVEIRNADGKVEAALQVGPKTEAALQVGPKTEAVKEFDAFLEYEEITHIQYPLAHEPHPSNRKKRIGLGTFVRISDFYDDGGKYKFSLVVNENVFERFETSASPSRIIRTPMVQKYEFKAAITLQEEKVEFGEMPDRGAWSAQVRRID